MPASVQTAVALEPAEWEPLQAAHVARVDALLADHLDRRTTPRTTPGRGLPLHLLPDPPEPAPHLAPRARGSACSAPRSTREGAATCTPTTRRELDPAEISRRSDSIRWIRQLLSGNGRPPAAVRLLRPARVGDGLPRTEEIRHETWPLRLGAEGTDRVVESHKIACSHFDAFRFFTAAGPPSERPPTHPRGPTRAGARRLPPRQHGPLQVGRQVDALRPQLVGPGLLRTGPRHPHPRHARLPLRLRPTWATSRSPSRRRPAKRPTPQPNGPSQTEPIPSASNSSNSAKTSPLSKGVCRG